MIYPSCLCVINIFTVELQRVLQLDEQQEQEEGGGEEGGGGEVHGGGGYKLNKMEFFLILVFQMFCDTSFHMCTYLQTDCAFRKNYQL